MSEQENVEGRRRMMRSIFVICNEAGIDRSDRIELACAVLELGTGLESYNDLSYDDLSIVYWALRHWKIIQSLRLLNGTLAIEAHILTDLENQLKIEDDLDTRKVKKEHKSETRPKRARVERDDEPVEVTSEFVVIKVKRDKKSKKIKKSLPDI